ncbi:histone deacetylase [Microbotryomycetes sp. JL221]|nr:histone deacetylase [Microbotryomycetes sp. JL221]
MSSEPGYREVSPFSASSSDAYLTADDQGASPRDDVQVGSSGLVKTFDLLTVSDSSSTALGPPSEPIRGTFTTGLPYVTVTGGSTWSALAAQPPPASSINTATQSSTTTQVSSVATPQAPKAVFDGPEAPNPIVPAKRARTCAIFQDACMLHKYSRPHDIGWIVERPERLRAIKTGVVAALARLELASSTSTSEASRATPPSHKVPDGALEQLMGALGIHDTNTSNSRDIVGGPFDILFSSASMAVDDPALTFIHPLPNLPPESAVTSPSTTSLPVPPSDDYASRPALTPYASPSKVGVVVDAPASAPPRLASPDTSVQPWPKQLSALCRNASKAMKTGPTFSEIPSHLPQGDLYLTERSESAIFGALGAVCEGVDRVVEGVNRMDNGHDRAFVAIRPPGHHCCENQPMGFCFVNNVAVAAAHAHQKHGINRVIILDIDLHHGNGTQDIAWRINSEANRTLLDFQASSPRKVSPKKGSTVPSGPSNPPEKLQIFYGSLHDIYSYPCEDGDTYNIQNASLNLAGGHSQWISNVHLDSWQDESDFYQRLYPAYRDKLLGAAKDFFNKTVSTGSEPQKDKTIVIISAGFDASEHESAGMSRHRRNVPTSFFHRFTKDACAFANQVANGKLVAVLEGGYSDRALASGALGLMVALVDAPRNREQLESAKTEKADVTSWWSEANLIKLEKACKLKRGKLVPWPVTQTGPRNTVNNDSEAWLSRTVELMSILEAGEQVDAETAAAAKVKKEPAAKTMQLRERRSRANLRDDRTPQASPARGVGRSNAGSNSAASATVIAPPPVPPMPVFGGRAFEIAPGTGGQSSITVSPGTSASNGLPAMAGQSGTELKPSPKVIFKFGAGGI